ncbi:tRNA (adenosine(37)-N6)-threonylcarbamoyltransferase complex dimerization subunit type 1 TsaB [Candidatus Pandoraea novymonadis]|uniref:tRNA threonylcarbamoyladenosine biosynthesis protein TsaB n=1 Tax=Candidatus Pandoraea novymonadis TaxID=1808959 RepID=A0ABX5FF23_9BURK|nr:tRNA (adenosine(37)-N6)-threonylcarbamoyltransferase complex dimerization subunit type 1 TsaB [Candidatus Pandoraea novymonadis]PSB92053.1 tRNA threonylcarbamoyladenosine biosynthesis protein TsaB [Candidatus Pandoraea novymonadis]
MYVPIKTAMSPITILALDTSTEFCSVTLYRTYSDTDMPKIVARHLDTGPISSTHILPAVREVLKFSGITLATCQAIAFGCGPGSFTGLRTACGVAQGLAFGANLPVLAINTLMTCAELVRSQEESAKRVLVALDARMDEVYWADFEWDDTIRDWRIVAGPSLNGVQEVPVPDLPFVLAGNAAVAFGERLSAVTYAKNLRIDAMPNSQATAILAARAFTRGEAIHAEKAMPHYVRNKVAQTTAERESTKERG